MFSFACVAAAVIGWQAALHFGVDYSRIPKPPFAPGQIVITKGDGPVFTSEQAAELRDALFAHHTGIDIAERITSGRITQLPAGTRLSVIEVDMELALVEHADQSAAGRHWIALDSISAPE